MVLNADFKDQGIWITLHYQLQAVIAWLVQVHTMVEKDLGAKSATKHSCPKETALCLAAPLYCFAMEQGACQTGLQSSTVPWFSTPDGHTSSSTDYNEKSEQFCQKISPLFPKASVNTGVVCVWWCHCSGKRKILWNGIG